MKTLRMLLIVSVSTVILLSSGCANNKHATENKNIIGQTAVITKSTFIFEQPNEICNNFEPLEKGNLIRIVSIKNKNWYYIEPVCQSNSKIEGYVSKKYFSFDLKNHLPNQGYINNAVIYEKPEINSHILFKKNSGAISINKRKNGWANCSFTGVKDNAWIKESEITYSIPDVLVK